MTMTRSPRTARLRAAKRGFATALAGFVVAASFSFIVGDSTDNFLFGLAVLFFGGLVLGFVRPHGWLVAMVGVAAAGATLGAIQPLIHSYRRMDVAEDGLIAVVLGLLFFTPGFLFGSAAAQILVPTPATVAKPTQVLPEAEVTGDLVPIGPSVEDASTAISLGPTLRVLIGLAILGATIILVEEAVKGIGP